jgi:protein TonB
MAMKRGKKCIILFFLALFYVNCSWLIHKKPKQEGKPASEFAIIGNNIKAPAPLVLPLPLDTVSVPFDELDEAPKAISQKPPIYNREYGSFEGTVFLRMLIGRDGSVIYAYVLKTSGNVLVDNEGLRTAMRWRFIPAKRKGEPVQCWLGAPIKFKTE